ncbi:MAG: ABC transporter permease [Firmicutes bacterium]|nr:ABC transporter permease [Bacillota bacterium]
MRAFLTMTKSNLKLLLRNIGFIICLIALPFGASALLMIQQSDSAYNDSSRFLNINKINEVDCVIQPTNTNVMVIDAAQDEASEIFLKSIIHGELSIYRYKAKPLERSEIDRIAKNYYERGTVTAVVYLGKDFNKNIMNGINPEVLLIEGRDDSRIELVKNKINSSLSIMMNCAANASSKKEFLTMSEKVFENMPTAQSVTVGEDANELTGKQSEQQTNIGHALAVLSMAFLLTGALVANLIVSERENKSILRIEMSGTSMGTYVLSKAFTGILVALIQTEVTAVATALLIGTDVGIPFVAFILFIGMMGVIFNLLCVVNGMYCKNITVVSFVAFGVWMFTNLLAGVYFNFVTFPDWWDKASMLTPQKWVMLCTEMLMKNQNGAYATFFTAAAGFLLLIITAGFIGTKVSDTTGRE